MLQRIFGMVVISVVAASPFALSTSGVANAAAKGNPNLTVTTTSDLPWPCGSAYSLRCAMIQANMDGSGDYIKFKIPRTDPGCSGTRGVCTLRPTSPLPALTASHTTIDGYTQPGSSPNTLLLHQGDNAVLAIRVDGTAAPFGEDGFYIPGSYDTIQGLEVTGFEVTPLLWTGSV